MSMKRTKAGGRGKGPSSRELQNSPIFGKKVEEIKWNFKEHVASQPDDAFVPYSMASTFQKGALIAHPKFGHGVVTLVDEKRIDVLFEEGAKKLGHAA